MAAYWEPPEKIAGLTEKRLVAAILEGRFPIASHLPGERDLARQLGVTRPTLREALQRLARDGWITISQGKSTRVCNYWEDGNLAVLAAIVDHRTQVPVDFVHNLLEVRTALAPVYTRLAVERRAPELAPLLDNILHPPDTAEAYAAADWELHYRLTIASGNPVFTLILNGFRTVYPVLAQVYFTQSTARQSSALFYAALLYHVRNADADQAERLVRVVMNESICLWESAVPHDE